MSDIDQIMTLLRTAERIARDLKRREPLPAAGTLHRRINEAKRIAGQIRKDDASVPRA